MQAYAYGARHRRRPPPSSAAGAVWPHDNASAVPLFLLPELFCGYSRREEEGPTFYPVACSPQAWANGCAGEDRSSDVEVLIPK